MADLQLEDVISVVNPEAHCNQAHNHQALPWTLPACDWQGNLLWSMNDAGFNEGAAEAAKIVAKYGLGVPPVLADLGGNAVGNLWKRREMMRFAVIVAKTGRVQEATGIAVASQWHNCHAFKCLVAHAPEVAAWLLKQ